VVSLTDDLRAAEAAVLDLIDLDVATRDPTVSAELRRRLTLMRERREEGLPGVRLSVAAGLLGLSERTVRDWAGSGPLDLVPGAKPARVSTTSLARVVPLVKQLQAMGQDRDLLRALLERLEDERVRSLPRVKKSLQQLECGDDELFSSADL
jgi:hypothetical protein